MTNEDKKVLVDELVETVFEEINRSSTGEYICNDGTVIITDVGYVEDWFRIYADVLKKKYNI